MFDLVAETLSVRRVAVATVFVLVNIALAAALCHVNLSHSIARLVGQ